MMTELSEPGHLPMGLVAAFSTTDSSIIADNAHQLARSMYLASKPPTQSLLGYALASSEWTLLGYQQHTGPVFDEVNNLRSVWWQHAVPENRERFFTAVEKLGQALRQAELIA